MQLPPLTPDTYFSKETLAWIQSLIPGDDNEFKPFSTDENLVGFSAELAYQILEGDPHEFEQMLEEYDGSVQQYREIPEFTRLVKLGLEYGVAKGSGACANYLGAAYYMGTFVEQDYASAKELYEIAEKKGVLQAIINLGYIYEYGRVGEVDYERAYKQYAKAAALGNSPEALYKLGDMYGRGNVEDADRNIAYYLYERSLKEAGENFVLAAQPAIRIAKLICDDEVRGPLEEDGIPFNPVRALELFQLAERGLRVDIALGAVYYKKRLAEAMEGQEKARMLIEKTFESGPDID